MESPGYYIPRVPQEPRDKVLDLGLPDKLYVADDILITQEESIYNSVVTVSPRDFNYAAMSEFFAKATVIKPNGSSITSSRDGNNAREEGSGDISEANPCNGTKTGPKKTENVCKTPKNWSSEYWDKVSRGQMRSSSRLTNFQNQTKSATEFTIRVASSSPLVSPSSTEPERRVWGFMRPTESSKRKSRN
ncbi:hypothetical protein NADFUDRAFT_84448 [Nadsonia fulvescens var. elongata DSM 6958]|uniref:Uncharacterized protein n=1 Tax=Nadsonia fulvescens var. elongata DSM 6958 TaxID=857566 RepID=A0A1E3PCZ4_9ASCO|nr:hypothetical protein NADFUDRAFT_84448 [Nadsonia fulvescens var. elongata DSM 6958]